MVGVTQKVVADSSTQVVSANGILVNYNPLPNGFYTMVGIDIDTTGRRLIDEIVQLAAYTPNDHFEQYIMPYMNLNPAARQRHQVRVISIGFYRMLKSMQTYKIIKSKSEIAALKDFLDWLEALKAKDTNSNGVILIYHEERKFIPYMILESLKKYNLLDRFLLTVKSFANGLNLAKNNANTQMQHYSLRKLSKVLSTKPNNGNKAATAIETDNVVESHVKHVNSNHNKGSSNDRDLFDGNASVRAKLAFDVALQLSNQDLAQPLYTNEAINIMLTELKPFAQPIDCDLNELQTQNANLERQNSFRPVFLNYFKTTLYHRLRAVKFRIILAENCHDLKTLNSIWAEKQKDGIIEILKGIEELKPDDKAELADLFDSFFDPAKTTIKPIIRSNNSNNRRRNRRSLRNRNEGSNNNHRPNATEQGAGGDKEGAVAQVPDSTTAKQTTQVNNQGNNSGGNSKPQRGRRNPRSRYHAQKSHFAPPTQNTAVAAN